MLLKSLANIFGFTGTSPKFKRRLHKRCQMQCPAETLEARRLLTVYIDVDTTWSGDVTLNDDVVVRNNATLTINDNSRIFKSSTSWDLFISDGSYINSENVDFYINTYFYGSIDSGDPSQSFTNNIFHGYISVHGHYLSELAGNDFASGSSLNTYGTIDRDTTWVNFNNNGISTIYMNSDIIVDNNSTLTIEDGITLINRSTSWELFIRNGSFLNADNVSFNSQVYFSGPVQSADPSQSFANNIFRNYVSVHGHYLSELAGNDFASGSSLNTYGTIDRDTTWVNFNNNGISTIYMNSDIIVDNNSTLTIEDGITLINRSTSWELFIRNGSFLNADNVSFNSQVYFSGPVQSADPSQSFANNIFRNYVSVHGHYL
ncbi:hypothetical protein, partial [uncultured Rubinisphaera sp.]|uniref:hypothetical protein n=1 Tax=uncultured Rubinisphaera sp. TaxID=1678686 RepID=UPI0030DB1055